MRATNDELHAQSQLEAKLEEFLLCAYLIALREAAKCSWCEKPYSACECCSAPDYYDERI